MTRTHLLGAASAVALACITTASAFAASTITGGGSTLAQFDYIDEFNVYNGSTTGATFGTYYESGSGAGQSGLLTDDLSCDINKVSGANGGNCNGGSSQGAPGNTVDYGASDATLSSTQISGWSSFALGQAAAGNLIQLPSMGVGIAIPVQNSAVKTNGALILNDADLCGVFSGQITDFKQLTVAKPSVTPTSGPITVVVRSDGSGTSFLLTNHLSKVCTTGAGGNSAITFTATTTFATLFPNSTLPSNFSAQKGSSGVASTLTGLTSAIAYLSPDFTTVDPNSDATINGNKSTLVVASVLNGKIAELPTTKNITAALARAVSGTTLTPPTTAAEGANPANWVPLIQTVSAGYPIVGYTTFDFAQCYADKTVGAGIIAFLNDHYTNASYTTPQSNNGFVTVANSGASKFLTAIRQHILSNKASAPAWNTDIDDKTACAHVAGR
jgi:ABC-type phosphate transport system substrate-binding protein